MCVWNSLSRICVDLARDCDLRNPQSEVLKQFSREAIKYLKLFDSQTCLPSPYETMLPSLLHLAGYEERFSNLAELSSISNAALPADEIITASSLHLSPQIDPDADTISILSGEITELEPIEEIKVKPSRQSSPSPILKPLQVRLLSSPYGKSLRASPKKLSPVVIKSSRPRSSPVNQPKKAFDEKNSSEELITAASQYLLFSNKFAAEKTFGDSSPAKMSFADRLHVFVAQVNDLNNGLSALAGDGGATS